MAKYTPQKDDEIYKFIERMTGFIMDVNPSEIASHIENDSLKQWCVSWQTAAKCCLVQAPFKYDSEEV